MSADKKDKIIYLLAGALIGLLVGIFITSIGGIAAYKMLKGAKYTRYEPKTQVARKINYPKAKLTGDFYLSFEDKSDLGIFKAAETTSFDISNHNVTHGKNSLMVKIDPGSSFPGLAWEVYGGDVQDWSGAKDFYFDVYNNTEDYIPLNVKFKSGRKYPKKTFSTLVQLEPLKINHVEIPIENIANSCDITQISYVKLFVQSPKKMIVLFFDNIGIKDAIIKEEAKEDEPGVIGEGFNIFVASSLNKIFKDGKTLLKPSFSDSASISLAKNEYESFQIVIKNNSPPLESVRLELSDLVDKETGAKIDKENITWRRVGYVETKKPYYPVKFVGLWPDPLLPDKEVDIKGDIAQPFWVTVYTPSEAQAGIYEGTIELKTADSHLQTIPLSVRVFDFTLPTESSLKTAFDFYPHITPKRYPQGEKETKEAYNYRIGWLNEQYIIDMLRHRINPILNINPLSQADLGRVDRYRLYGLNNFSIGKRGGTFNNNWPKDDKDIEGLLPLYRTYGENLKINKMTDYHYIYTWDEGKIGNPQVKKITSMIHRAHPELKNMVCYHGFWDPDRDPEWGRDIDIWCFGIGDFIEAKMKRLKESGMEMWMYVSGPGGSGDPNLAIDFDSIDYRIIPWLCWKYDIKGFLYWCVNWWPYVDPFESASNTKWNQNGNGLLYYPGANGPIASLRLEIFRDGMEDYEYLIMLNDRLKSFHKKGLRSKYPEIYKKSISLLIIDKPLAGSMRNFTKNSKVLLDRRKEIAETIEEIDRLLRAEEHG